MKININFMKKVIKYNMKTLKRQNESLIFCLIKKKMKKRNRNKKENDILA